MNYTYGLYAFVLWRGVQLREEKTQRNWTRCIWRANFPWWLSQLAKIKYGIKQFNVQPFWLMWLLCFLLIRIVIFCFMWLLWCVGTEEAARRSGCGNWFFTQWKSSSCGASWSCMFVSCILFLMFPRGWLAWDTMGSSEKNFQFCLCRRFCLSGSQFISLFYAGDERIEGVDITILPWQTERIGTFAGGQREGTNGF